MTLASTPSFRWPLLGLFPCLGAAPLAAQAGNVRWEAKISKTAGPRSVRRPDAALIGGPQRPLASAKRAASAREKSAAPGLFRCCESKRCSGR